MTQYPKATDDPTGARIAIEYEHHKIHAGDHFTISGFDGVDGSLDIGDVVDITVQTPSTGRKYAHVIWDIRATSQFEFYVYENAVGSGGVTHIPINNNRNSTKKSMLTIDKDPTITDVGDLLFSESTGLAGQPSSKAQTAGHSSRAHELILKANTKYLFRTIVRADNTIVNYVGSWYEQSGLAVAE
jgi:hypothetical protein